MCGTGKSQISFAEVPLDRATQYAAEDAEVALRLWKLLKLRLPLEGGTRIYEMVDRPLVATVEAMERAGIMVDRDYLAKLRSEEHTSELQSLMRISYAVFCLKKKNNRHNYIYKPT